MKHLCNTRTFIVLLLTIFAFIVEPAIVEAKRGGGGRSFGGSRSFRSPSRTYSSPSKPSSRSFGRSTSASKPSSSFGGSRFRSGADYRSSYGTPRKSTTQSINGANGRQNVVVHSYGGMSDGFMMGYMMGQTSLLWMTPFHPAFYYSRPHYVTGANGMTEVYPPTFSFLNLILGLIIIGGIVYLIYRLFFARKKQQVLSDSSFG
jgi:hypothetical protein